LEILSPDKAVAQGNGDVITTESLITSNHDMTESMRQISYCFDIQYK
jgi:hypothetical protein